MLRQCPSGIAQRPQHHAVAVPPAMQNSHNDYVSSSTVGKQLKQKSNSLSTAQHPLPALDLSWASFFLRVQLTYLLLISPGLCKACGFLQCICMSVTILLHKLSNRSKWFSHHCKFILLRKSPERLLYTGLFWAPMQTVSLKNSHLTESIAVNRVVFITSANYFTEQQSLNWNHCCKHCCFQMAHACCFHHQRKLFHRRTII